MSLVRHGPPLERTAPDQPKPTSLEVSRPAGLALRTAAVEGPQFALAVTSDLRAVETEWRAFEKTADRTAFQAFDWVDKWQTHIGAPAGVLPAIVTGRAPDGTLKFLLPLAVAKSRLARRLTWLASDLCDYNAPLLAPDFAGAADWSALWRQILSVIRADRSLRFDLVDLEKMPAKVGGQPNPMLALGAARHPDDAHVATLGTDWDSFYRERRSSSTRKVQRKHLNRLADNGELRFVDDRAAQTVAHTLDTLMEQKRRALARMGVADMFAKPGMRAFYTAVANDPAMADWVHVSRLDAGPEVAATSVALLHKGRYCLILSSYNDGPMSTHGPGRAHLHELLRYAIEHGFKEFDFTIGNEPYKLDWSDIRVALYDHLSGASLRGAAVKPALAAAIGAKRFIKNNTVTWHAFEALRSRFGGKRKSAAAPASADDET